MLRRATLSSLRRATHRATAPTSKTVPYLLYNCRKSKVVAHCVSQQALHFSSEAILPPPLNLTEHEFMELADKTLHDIQSWLDGIEEMLEECDVMFAQGVLKIDLGEHGTWVINRQVPNRQIWWSSPISGPRRYEYDAESGHWINTRDKSELMERLHTEILDATGIEIYT